MLDAIDSVAELPLPVIPEAVWYVSEEAVSGSGYLTRRFFLRIGRNAAFAGRVLFRVAVATGLQAAFF